MGFGVRLCQIFLAGEAAGEKCLQLLRARAGDLGHLLSAVTSEETENHLIRVFREYAPNPAGGFPAVERLYDFRSRAHVGMLVARSRGDGRKRANREAGDRRCC